MTDKKLFIVLALTALLLAATAAPAIAGGYCSQHGCDVSGSQTECFGHGAFGAFGDKGDIGIHDFGHVYPGDSNGKPGANGELTGSNNSHLCGNPQN